MIYDLSARIAGLKSRGRILDRMAEAAETLPDVGVVALNGIPFVGDPPSYFGVSVTPELVREQLMLGLGFGGVLTFMNPVGYSLESLARMSLEHGHGWAMHGVTVTLCFAGAPTFVELSFARDGRFHMSWVEPKGSTDWAIPRVFTATASLKRWSKYVANRNSPDFLKTQQHWLGLAHAELVALMPDYF